MKTRAGLLIGFSILTFDLAGAQEPAPLPDLPPVVIPEAALPGPEAGPGAISESGQFRVYGGQQSQRSSLALLLEESATTLKSLLKEGQAAGPAPRPGKGAEVPPAAPMIPIDVVLEGKPGDPPKARQISYDLRFAGTTFLLSMHIDMARGIDNEGLDHAALTLLLYERSLRGLKPADIEGRLVVRPWLVEGLGEAKRWDQNGRGDWQLYEGVMKAGGGFTLDELFEMTDDKWETLDPSSRLAFRALSGATVMALLSQPEGERSFSSFIGEAARNAGETPVLMRRYFPDLNLSEKSLAKWVQLTLAKKGQPDSTELMSISTTEAGLVEALKFHFRDKDGNAVVREIGAWQEVAALKPSERVAAVRVAQDSLVRLSFRCFPSYRDTLVEYQHVLLDLAKGDTKKIEQRLVELNDERQVRKSRAERARDYMDYFEISRARDLSGEFGDYMKLKRELDEHPRLDRTDRMSHALDLIDSTFEPRIKPKR